MYALLVSDELLLHRLQNDARRRRIFLSQKGDEDSSKTLDEIPALPCGGAP